MIKDKKILIVFSSLLVLLIVGLVLVLLFVKDDTTNNSSSSKEGLFVVKQFESDTISSIDVSNDKGSFLLVQNSKDAFSVKGVENVKLNQYYVSSFFDFASNILAVKNLGDFDDLKQFGLSPAASKMNVLLSNGESFELLLGSKLVDGTYYFCITGNNTVYTLEQTYANPLLSEKFALYDPNISNGDISVDTVNYFSVYKNDVLDVRIDKNKNFSNSSSSGSYVTFDSQFLITQPFSWNANDVLVTGNNKDIIGILSSVATFSFDNIVADVINNDTLSKFSLLKPAFKIVTDAKKQSTIFFSEKQPNGTYYCYSDYSSLIGLVSVSKFPFLEKDSSYFCNGLINVRDIKSIDKLSVISGDESYEFSLTNSDKSGDEMKVNYNGNELNSESFRSLYIIALGPTITGFSDKPSVNAYVTVKYHLKDGTTDIVEYFNTGGLECFARLNGNGRFFVFKEKVDKILSATKDYVAGKEIKAN